jgi:hypothetical protein
VDDGTKRKSRGRIGEDVVDEYQGVGMALSRTAGTGGTASWAVNLSDGSATITASSSPGIFPIVPDMVPYVPLVTTAKIRT